MEPPLQPTVVLGKVSNGLSHSIILIVSSTLTLEVNTANELSCIASLDSDTLWYQLETEEATTYTEICLPQNLDASDSILRARISATPIMLVRESSDSESAPTLSAGASPVRSPSTVPTPRSSADATVFGSAVSDNDSHPYISNSGVAGIATAATLSVILLVAICLCFRAWRRRSSNHKLHPGASGVDNSSSSNPCEEAKAEMEDPVSARELLKQSGAYRGKPELGSEVDRTQNNKPDEADRILPSSPQDRIAEDSSPGHRGFHGLGHAYSDDRLGHVYPAELE